MKKRQKTIFQQLSKFWEDLKQAFQPQNEFSLLYVSFPYTMSAADYEERLAYRRQQLKEGLIVLVQSWPKCIDGLAFGCYLQKKQFENQKSKIEQEQSLEPNPCEVCCPVRLISEAHGHVCYNNQYPWCKCNKF